MTGTTTKTVNYSDLPSHVPSLSGPDEAELSRLACLSIEAADAGQQATSESLHADVVAFRRQAEIRACLRVAAKLDYWRLDGREPEKHADWTASAAALRATADLL